MKYAIVTSPFESLEIISKLRLVDLPFKRVYLTDPEDSAMMTVALEVDLTDDSDITWIALFNKHPVLSDYIVCVRDVTDHWGVTEDNLKKYAKSNNLKICL
jgi:hypothetical protein